MKYILITLFSVIHLNAQNCSAFLAEKQKEIDLKIEELDEARQALESYKAAFLAIQKEKEERNENLLAEMKKQEAKINEIRNHNAKILAEIRQLKEEIIENKANKVSQTYAKMKDASAAAILETMDENEILKIFLTLEPKKLSAILSKMTPAKAGEITKMLNDTKLESKK